MNHLAFAAAESHVSNAERRWANWIGKAEDMLGRDLDGDQAADGYSIDGAHAAFAEGQSVVEYVLGVRAAIDDRESA